MNATRYNKLWIASIPVALAGLKVVSDALGDGIVSTQEWLAAVVAALTAYGVWQIPNFPSAGQPRDPEMSEQAADDAGAVDLSFVVGVLVGALGMLLLAWIFDVTPAEAGVSWK